MSQFLALFEGGNTLTIALDRNKICNLSRMKSTIFGLGAISLIAYLATKYFWPQLKRRPHFFDPTVHPAYNGERNWDAVDEASWESFPASDPAATY